MKKVGIICEYNPFHNGHVYHIDKIKKMFPDSIIILVLGGYFLERGEVSLISKWNKTKIALDYGVDLVLELPCLYGTNSADLFAYHAVKILDTAKVDTIVFGSESDDIELLYDVALKQKQDGFDLDVKKHLSTGANYPTSLKRALNFDLKSNDILGVAYIKAIMDINPNINHITIKRTNEYDDTLQDDSIVSAKNIRKKLEDNLPIEKYIPAYDNSMINKIDEGKLFELIRYKIITDSHLDRYLGVDEGLENKLKKSIRSACSYEELIDSIKSKRYTTSRLKRMLIHILLGIEKIDLQKEPEDYRILGFSKTGKEYLKELKPANLNFKSSGRSRKIELIASTIYYDLTKDESAKLDFLNRPIQK